MGRKNGYGAQVFIDNMPGTGGIIGTLAKRVGCDWHTAKRYVDEYPTVRQAYNDECEDINDIAESTIINSIKDGDIPSAKWWLSKKRKKTFGDSLDVTSDGKPIAVIGLGLDTDEI